MAAVSPLYVLLQRLTVQDGFSLTIDAILKLQLVLTEQEGGRGFRGPGLV